MNFQWSYEAQERLKGLGWIDLKILYRAVGDVVHLIESEGMGFGASLDWAKDRYQKVLTKKSLKSVEALVRNLYPKDYFAKRARAQFAKTDLGRAVMRARRNEAELDQRFVFVLSGEERKTMDRETLAENSGELTVTDLQIGKQLRDKNTGAVCTIIGYEYEEKQIFKDDDHGWPLSVPVSRIVLQFAINVNVDVPISREFDPHPRKEPAGE